MITINSKIINRFSQESYNNLINEIDISSLPCSCKVKGQLIKYGFYNRRVKTKGKSIMLRIQRVLCKSCRKTHGLLQKDIVPYSQISIHDHLLIIETYLDPLSGESNNAYEDIMIDNEFINENSIRYIINKYINFWHEALLSLYLTISNNLNLIIGTCINKFKKQFMQVKDTINILYEHNNIT